MLELLLERYDFLMFFLCELFHVPELSLSCVAILNRLPVGSSNILAETCECEVLELDIVSEPSPGYGGLSYAQCLHLLILSL